MRNIRIIIAVLFFSFIVWFLHNVFFSKDIPEITTIKLKEGNITTSITTTGWIRPVNEVEIISKTQALVKNVLVEEGDEIKRESLLLKFDIEETKNLYDQVKEKLNEAYVELECSKRELNREEKLFSIGAISKAQLQRYRDRYNIAKIKLKMIQEELSLVELKLKRLKCISPIDGIIITSNVKDGQFVLAGHSLFTIADTSTLEVECNVDELDSYKIRIGNKAIITTPMREGIQLLGTVTKIAPKVLINHKGRHNIVKVTVTLTNTNLPYGLRLGGQVDVKIITQTKHTYYLPVDVVLEDKGGRFVFVYDGGYVKKKMVATGISNLSCIEVFGLNKEDKIIKPYGIELEEGMRVRKR
jgi:HlyD family secretion protein